MSVDMRIYLAELLILEEAKVFFSLLFFLSLMNSINTLTPNIVLSFLDLSTGETNYQRNTTKKQGDSDGRNRQKFVGIDRF